MNFLPTYYPPDYPAPAHPVTGKGNRRSPFPFNLRTPEGKACWNAIPAAHKTIGSGRRHFVSIEVNARLRESQRKF